MFYFEQFSQNDFGLWVFVCFVIYYLLICLSNHLVLVEIFQVTSSCSLWSTICCVSSVMNSVIVVYQEQTLSVLESEATDSEPCQLCGTSALQYKCLTSEFTRENSFCLALSLVPELVYRLYLFHYSGGVNFLVSSDRVKGGFRNVLWHCFYRCFK